jgi:hypothetical protein
LPTEGDDLESLIQAHRHLHFHWRGTLANSGRDERILGQLHGRVSQSMCRAVPANTAADHPVCPPDAWTYEVPKSPDRQATQLLGEHRRLVRHIAFLRNPVPPRRDLGDWPLPQPRQLTTYEKLILSAWDRPAPVLLEIDAFLAEHVHDSVAHFTSWPCALHDLRGVFCDVEKYYANTPGAEDELAALA